MERIQFILNAANEIEKKGWCVESFPHPLFDLLFPDGLFQAAKIYIDWINLQVVQDLEKQDISNLKTFSKIRLGVLTRFKVLMPHKQIEKALFYYLLKHPKSVSVLYTIVDDLWNFAGDTSLDYNFYTKRVILSGVYTSCFFEFLKSDSSLESVEEKLDLRLAQVGKIPALKDKLKNLLKIRA